MFRKSLLAGFAGLAMAAMASVPAHANQWVMLGQQSVGQNVDRDVYIVGRDEGRFEALRFRVFGNRVAFAEARVVYGNGTSEVLDVKEHVQAGEMTRPYDLKGQHRIIDRIEFLYQAEIPSEGTATVQVYGLKYTSENPGPFPPGPFPPAPSNWEALGTKEVHLKVDHDVIRVGHDMGRFRTLRFHVTGRPIHLYNIRVTYGNGEQQEFTFDQYVSPGTFSPQLDLIGNRRRIEKIDLVYRKHHRGGHAYLTVYGKH